MLYGGTCVIVFQPTIEIVVHKAMYEITVQKAWPRPYAMDCLLKFYSWCPVWPYRSPAGFAALADQDIARLNREFVELVSFKQHFFEVGKVNVKPSDVWIT